MARKQQPSDPGKPWHAVLLRVFLVTVAVIYLGSIWLGGLGSRIPSDMLPRPALYYTQIACLFPRAARMSIEYRAEALRCDDGQWEEVDTTTMFPIHAGDKENRYHRAMFFHRRKADVMRELDDYVWERLPDTSPEGYGPIRFLSLRIPFGEPGEPFDRYVARPLADYPEDQRKRWWSTPKDDAIKRCRDRGGRP